MSLPVSNSTWLDEFWNKIWLNLQNQHTVVSLIYFSKDLLGENESLIRFTKQLGLLVVKKLYNIAHSSNGLTSVEQLFPLRANIPTGKPQKFRVYPATKIFFFANKTWRRCGVRNFLVFRELKETLG